LDTPNDTSDPNALDPTLEKVHLRGLDNLTTKDIRTFASEYFPSHSPLYIQWIDDASANLIYESPEIALEALGAFAAVEMTDVSQIPVLQTIQAKLFPLHPETSLQVRLAVAGDRKQAGARERSRFYLFNPEYDPAERRKRAGNKYRDRGDGGYQSQRYDDREQRRRERDPGFDASLYDDVQVAVAQPGQDSSSGSERGRGSRRVNYRGTAGKELFPDRGDGGNGRLRNRSASPLRDNDGDQDMRESRNRERNRLDTAVAANRLKAQMIKAQLRDSGSPKELFPQKANINHRRSAAFDAADETADLFANRMAVPFMDGSGDSRAGGSLASRITKDINAPGFTIRGSAKSQSVPVQNFSIKGAARVKELFPATLGDNTGKELFSERLEGRGRRRQKAEDLFL
jgi:hypothetical protein